MSFYAGGGERGVKRERALTGDGQRGGAVVPGERPREDGDVQHTGSPGRAGEGTDLEQVGRTVGDGDTPHGGLQATGIIVTSKARTRNRATARGVGRDFGVVGRAAGRDGGVPVSIGGPFYPDVAGDGA